MGKLTSRIQRRLNDDSFFIQLDEVVDKILHHVLQLLATELLGAWSHCHKLEVVSLVPLVNREVGKADRNRA